MLPLVFLCVASMIGCVYFARMAWEQKNSNLLLKTDWVQAMELLDETRESQLVLMKRYDDLVGALCPGCTTYATCNPPTPPQKPPARYLDVGLSYDAATETVFVNDAYTGDVEALRKMVGRPGIHAVIQTNHPKKRLKRMRML